jgi:hypothetical protein
VVFPSHKIYAEIKAKVVPVHALKTYNGSGGTSPLILGGGWSTSRPSNFIPWKYLGSH